MILRLVVWISRLRSRVHTAEQRITPEQSSISAITCKADAAGILRKRVYTAFSATMALAMTVVVAYVAERLHNGSPNPLKAPTANGVSGAADDHALTLVPNLPTQVAASTQRLIDEAEPSLRTEPISISDPRPGDIYLQVAALHSPNVQRYLPALKAKGFHATVALGPGQGVYRILIGPFPDRVSREQQRQALDAAGIESMLRIYEDNSASVRASRVF